MRYLLFVLLLLNSGNLLADCNWSEKKSIPNNNKLTFQVCSSDDSIKINEIIVKPRIDFELIYPNCPECNSIWSVISKNNKTALVYIENVQYERNAWIINLESQKVELFIDKTTISPSKHYLVKFTNNEQITIGYAGMSYKTEHYYDKIDDVWTFKGYKAIELD